MLDVGHPLARQAACATARKSFLSHADNLTSWVIPVILELVRQNRKQSAAVVRVITVSDVWCQHAKVPFSESDL